MPTKLKVKRSISISSDLDEAYKKEAKKSLVSISRLIERDLRASKQKPPVAPNQETN